MGLEPIYHAAWPRKQEKDGGEDKEGERSSRRRGIEFLRERGGVFEDAKVREDEAE